MEYASILRPKTSYAFAEKTRVHKKEGLVQAKSSPITDPILKALLVTRESSWNCVAFNLDVRTLTFSQYKNHNTVKFLECTLSGKVSVVLKLYGRKTSDKQMIRLSGFLEQIRPGDAIFEVRGYPVKEVLAKRGTSLVLSASTKVNEAKPCTGNEAMNCGRRGQKGETAPRPEFLLNPFGSMATSRQFHLRMSQEDSHFPDQDPFFKHGSTEDGIVTESSSCR
ncbi:hypothetical protein TNCV_1367901 [Trichonephila clavipes]|nr:hypothetical protein TNCV_1367901 [Trichonephila clavipes]